VLTCLSSFRKDRANQSFFFDVLSNNNTPCENPCQKCEVLENAGVVEVLENTKDVA
jgi:hypothetical protein